MRSVLLRLATVLDKGSAERRVILKWAAQPVGMKEENDMVYVWGPYNVMAENINPKLKSQGFTWNPTKKMWQLPSAKLTPIKRKNLLEALKLYLPTTLDTRPLSEQNQDRIDIRKSKGLCISLPYAYRNKAVDAGGLWDESNKTWCMPDIEAFKQMEALISVTITELQRRKNENLSVQIPFELKDHAKALGGLWDTATRLWYMPDVAAQQKILGMAREKKKQENSPLPTLGKVFARPGRSKTDHPQVGDTFFDNGLWKVVSVRSNYYSEDGLTFGLRSDSGWMHLLTCVPTEDADALLKHTNKVQEALNVKEANERKHVLVKLVRAKGQVPSGMHTLDSKRVLIEGKSSIPYGGGSWFHILPSQIWYVQNNGHDGDMWADNNVNTGGAGGIGWVIPYDDDVAKEILELDAFFSQRG